MGQLRNNHRINCWQILTTKIYSVPDIIGTSDTWPTVTTDNVGHYFDIILIKKYVNSRSIDYSNNEIKRNNMSMTKNAPWGIFPSMWLSAVIAGESLRSDVVKDVTRFVVTSRCGRFAASMLLILTIRTQLPLAGCVAQLAERRSLAGKMTLSYARPAVDGWPLCG